MPKSKFAPEPKLDPRSLWLFWDFNAFISWPEDLEKLYKQNVIIQEEYEWRKEWSDICQQSHDHQAEFLECMKIMDYLGGLWLNNKLPQDMQPYDPKEYPKHLRPLIEKYPKFVAYICVRYFG